MSLRQQKSELGTERDRLRLLHILSGDLWAGKEVQVVLQSAALQKLDWEIEVLLFNSGETERRAQAAGLKTRVYDEQLRFRQIVQQVLRDYGSIKPSLIVAHGHKELALALILSFRHGVPVVSTFHGALEKHTGILSLKVRAAASLRKLASKLFAKKIVVVSNALAEELGIVSGKTAVVRNVTPVSDQAPPPPARSIVELFVKQKTIVVVGRLVGVKRVTLALESFAELSKRNSAVHLYIIGEGPDRTRLEQFAQSLGCAARVHFLGFQPTSDWFIASAQTLLLTSLREGIPTVVLEAINYGTPIVSTPLPGVREVLELTPGYPCRFGNNPETLARALEEALGESSQTPKNPALWRSALTQSFSPESAAFELDLIYREASKR